MCLDDQDLVRLLTRDASPPRLADWREHVGRCEQCAGRMAALQATWDELGQWEVSPPAGDVTAAVLAAAAVQRTERHPAQWARLAAALVFSAGIGWIAGSWTPRPVEIAQPTALSVEDISAELGFTALGQDLELLDAVLFAPQAETVLAPEEPS